MYRNPIAIYYISHLNCKLRRSIAILFPHSSHRPHHLPSSFWLCNANVHGSQRQGRRTLSWPGPPSSQGSNRRAPTVERTCHYQGSWHRHSSWSRARRKVDMVVTGRERVWGGRGGQRGWAEETMRFSMGALVACPYPACQHSHTPACSCTRPRNLDQPSSLLPSLQDSLSQTRPNIVRGACVEGEGARCM